MLNLLGKKILFSLLSTGLLCISAGLAAQSPVNFSGNWLFDKTGSSAGLLESGYPGTVSRQISQATTTLSMKDTYSQPGNDDWTTAEESYTTDGKELSTTSSVGTNRTKASWSADKKVLTITSLDIQTLKGKQEEFLVVENWSLSADGKTLTIEVYSKNPVTGETNAIKLYRKK